jgi:hypothetical protein
VPSRFTLLPIIMLLLGFPAAAQQYEPKSAVNVTANGIFELCPKLILTHSAPDTAELDKLGFAVTESRKPGEIWFTAPKVDAILLLSYSPSTARCTLNYLGKGYPQIAEVVRQLAAVDEFKRITGGDKDGAKADVYEGKAPEGRAIARIIVIENHSNHSAAISYSERAGS